MRLAIGRDACYATHHDGAARVILNPYQDERDALTPFAGTWRLNASLGIRTHDNGRAQFGLLSFVRKFSCAEV